MSPPLDPAAGIASSILSRLLLSIPAAALSEEGVEIRALAEALEVEPERLLRDFAELEGRSGYLHAGMGDQIQLAMDSERVQVRTTGHFRRPVRLTLHEALALALGLRMLGVDPETEALWGRLLGVLTGRDEHTRGVGVSGTAVGAGQDPVLPILESALNEGTAVLLRYRAAGREPESRLLLPGVMAHAEGHWYLIGRDLERQALRVFRCDRILEATGAPEQTPAPFTEAEWEAMESAVGPGRIFLPPLGDRNEPVRIHYSARIAPWILEHHFERVEAQSDGSLVVTHLRGDGVWVVAHVLSYSGDAELLSPPDLRAQVARVARRFVDPSPSPT
jgi:predicted DNA-binding transcriptional regulator YafY